MLRIGQGYDSHQFTDGNCVPIGAVKIPYKKGIKSHSDGDVLLHAVGDALLGAATLGDLGRHFPDTDAAFSAIASSELIKNIMKLLQEKKYQVVNVDSTVIAQAPRLSQYIDEMRHNIAELLLVTVDQVSVKATTNEKMGWIGREEGIAAQAVVLYDTLCYG